MDAEVKLHSGRCRESIRLAMMSDDRGQQKLHEMEQRRGATRGQVLDAPRVTGGQESSAPRVKTSHEGQYAEMTATCQK